MNISFFGASVTQQKTGYAQMIKQFLNNFNINVHGYGSMHIHDAGVCFLDDVVKNKPDYCFIDWFSTGYINNYINEYLDTITYKLQQNHDCTIIYLFFDRTDMNDERLEMYEVAKKYADSHNIYYIELYNNNNINELIKDQVHTNDFGSNFYAQKIYSEFMSRIYNKNLPKIIVDKTKYCDIKVLDYMKEINDKLVIKGNGKIVGIYQSIGPYSGRVKINNNIIDVIDIWCVYERNNIKISVDVNDHITIEVLKGKTSEYSWETEPKCLKIIKIFYIGNIFIEN